MSLTTNTLSYLKDSTKIAPMLLIEIPTSAGRTYQGYKRGGKTEGKERLFEESLSAVVWLFGVKTFNKIGDFFGEHILGLKDLNTDVGKDSLRNPFGYVKDRKNLTAIFKFSKIISSAALGTLTMGYLVPKIKIAMTNAIRKKDGLEPYPDKKDINGYHKENWADKLVKNIINEDNRKKLNPKNTLTLNSFINATKQNQNLAFRGNDLLNGVLFASHNLENNTIWRLLSTDVGTLSGRVATSRTKKEKIEYFTRDTLSSLFYFLAAPLFSKMISNLTNTPDVHPKGADVLSEEFKSVIKNTSVAPDYFSPKKLSGIPKQILSTIPFSKDNVITLDEFNNSTGKTLKNKAELMSKLQPEYISANGIKNSILSKKQVEDILSFDKISDPKILKRAISAATGGKSDNPKAFISRKKLEKIRKSFDDYAIGLEKYVRAKAKDNNPILNSSIIEDYTKKLNRKNLLIHLSGVGFAIFGLSYLVPKFQYYVSEKITGEKEFLGSFKNNNKNNNSK